MHWTTPDEGRERKSFLTFKRLAMAEASSEPAEILENFTTYEELAQIERELEVVDTETSD